MIQFAMKHCSAPHQIGICFTAMQNVSKMHASYVIVFPKKTSLDVPNQVLRDHFMQVGAPEGRNPLCAHDGVYNLPQYLPRFNGHGMLAAWIDGVLVYTENHKAG